MVPHCDRFHHSYSSVLGMLLCSKAQPLPHCQTSTREVVESAAQLLASCVREKIEGSLLMQLQLGGPRPSHRVASVRSHRVCMPDSFLSHAVHILPVVCAHVFEAFPATCFFRTQARQFIVSGRITRRLSSIATCSSGGRPSMPWQPKTVEPHRICV